MYDPPWHLSSFLSQMCKHYYPWVILSGVVKIRKPLLSPPRQTHHQNTTSGGGDGARGKEGARRRGESDGNGADVCVAVDLWRDKGATQAAGIDGLLVRTGPSVSCFQND